jgi:hypothetical protein
VNNPPDWYEPKLVVSPIVNVYGPIDISSGILGDGEHTFGRNLPWFTPVQTVHPLDLGERNVVSILQTMSRLIQTRDNCV